MRLRHFLVPLVVAAVGVAGIQGAASAAPVTKQNFSLTADISEGGGGPVVASGAINATGEDIVISDTEDQFVFPDGTLTIIHAPVRSKDHFNDKKCTGRFHEAGTYVISAGTDQYEGVTGSGRYRAAGSFENGCQEIPTGTFSIRARGSINLPS
jgi:hypothetical protein